MRSPPYLALFSLMAMLVANVSVAAEDERRPNVVLILADDLGIETLGCYGGESYRTPALDKLAREGLRFTHAYAQPLCTNTRVQLMTGKYNHRNWKAFGILDPKERTFGHALSEAGYATLIAGKWQLQSYDPPDYPGAAKRRGTGMHAKDAGFDEYSLWHTGHTELKGSRYADPVILDDGKFRKDTKGRYGADVWVEKICDFITRKRQQPFFVYFPMALPHGPFVPTPHSTVWKRVASRHETDVSFYRDMVEYMDFSVGRIVRKIDELGLREDTLIIFFSDNGTPQEVTSVWRKGEELRGGKGLTTDAGTRVPLIVSWRGTTPEGGTTKHLVDSTDFFATLLDAARRPLPKGRHHDGRSFFPLLTGADYEPRAWSFFHYDPRPGWDKDQFSLHRFARTQRWKLYDDGRFFDIPSDPHEKRPLPLESLSKEASATRSRLDRVLRRMKTPAGSTP